MEDRKEQEQQEQQKEQKEQERQKEQKQQKGQEERKKLEEINVSTPHDKGYKKDLSNPKEFLHFLRKYVGAEWMKGLTESQLSLCDKEMLEKDYEGKEADLIYRVMMADGQETYIFILQELQSHVDYTMVFRILVYVVNTLLKHFLDTDKNTRERSDFRLPAMVPVVFYNGSEKWTALTSLWDYQKNGRMFGGHVLNLEYYLVDLSKVEEDYILSTNTVLDNIMYCDKSRERQELQEAIRTAYGRVKGLGAQELEEFRNWVKYILLSICGNKEAVVEEILNWTGNGDEDMAFKYNIIRAFEEERTEGKVEGRAEERAEAVIDLLEDLGEISAWVKEEVMRQKDLDTLRKWHKIAARAETVEEFIRQAELQPA